MISPSEFLPPAAAATCASLAWPSPNAMDAMVVSVRSGISIMSLVCRRHHYYALSDSGFFRGRVTGVALGMMKLPSKPKAPDPASAFPWPNKMLTAAPAIECPKNNTCRTTQESVVSIDQSSTAAASAGAPTPGTALLLLLHAHLSASLLSGHHPMPSPLRLSGNKRGLRLYNRACKPCLD
eukprot:GHVU01140709.1.p1 GENE.GHVU01140709.1~~GHVU01140709.1.p1  ORF type:complete len:181 (+),score=16.86 GHVU01140709.1:310-852(+)